MRARLADVAKLANVHPATASRALNERTRSRVSPETLDRIMQAADALNYLPNTMARSLASARSSTIGVVSCSDTPPDHTRVSVVAGLVADGGGGAGATLAAACSVPTLACATNKLVGAAVNAQALDDVPAYAEVLAREFDYITPENVMKWGPLQATQGAWDFSAADALVANAAANGQSVKGHALVWHLQMPDWASGLPDAALIDAVHAHVSTTVKHFRGKLRAWDVVNEAIADGGANAMRQAPSDLASSFKENTARLETGSEFSSVPWRNRLSMDHVLVIATNGIAVHSSVINSFIRNTRRNWTVVTHTSGRKNPYV